MKKKCKKPFKEIVKEVPVPKIVKEDTILPALFDTLWDAKVGKDLKYVRKQDHKLLREILVENGFDANKFFDDWESEGKLILHHDDSPCYERLEPNGLCKSCGYHPDMQSTCFHSYCRICNVELKNMVCPACSKKYERSSL